MGGVWVARKLPPRIEKFALRFFDFATYMAKSVHAGQRTDGAGHHAGGVQTRH
jgi:hypothetical protein